jgi:transposase
MWLFWRQAKSGPVIRSAPAAAGIREAITARRAQLFYLPAYSPDMNPIEMAFAKLKALLRQDPARTVDTLIKAIGRLLDRFTPNECANFFNAAGYQRSM